MRSVQPDLPAASGELWLMAQFDSPFPDDEDRDLADDATAFMEGAGGARWGT